MLFITTTKYCTHITKKLKEKNPVEAKAFVISNLLFPLMWKSAAEVVRSEEHGRVIESLHAHSEVNRGPYDLIAIWVFVSVIPEDTYIV